MSALNNTFNGAIKPVLVNGTAILDVEPSVEWYNSPYIIYLIRTVAIGGSLFAIRHVFLRYRNQTIHDDSQSLEVDHHVVAIEADTDGFELTDLDLEAGLVRHLRHPAPATQPANTIGSLHSRGNKGSSDEPYANGHEENGIQNAEGSGVGHGAPTT